MFWWNIQQKYITVISLFLENTNLTVSFIDKKIKTTIFHKQRSLELEDYLNIFKILSITLD